MVHLEIFFFFLMYDGPCLSSLHVRQGGPTTSCLWKLRLKRRKRDEGGENACRWENDRVHVWFPCPYLIILLHVLLFYLFYSLPGICANVMRDRKLTQTWRCFHTIFLLNRCNCLIKYISMSNLIFQKKKKKNPKNHSFYFFYHLVFLFKFFKKFYSFSRKNL